MKNKLKPCPFCGGEATIKRNLYGDYYIACNNKNCLCVAFTIIFARESEAIGVWNRRGGCENNEDND